MNYDAEYEVDRLRRDHERELHALDRECNELRELVRDLRNELVELVERVGELEVARAKSA